MLFSCSSGIQEPSTFNIDIENIENAQLKIDIKDIVPLETGSNSLMARITKVEYFNHRYYFFDRFGKHTLFVFDEKGGFLNKTKQGKGPGEVVRPDAFTINKEDSTILFYDTPQKSFLSFNSNLDYITSTKCDDLVLIYDYYHINKDTFLIYHHHPTSIPYSRERDVCNYSLYTQNFTKQELLNIPLINNKGIIDVRSPVSIIGSEVLFVTPWNHNIYQLQNGQTKLWSKLDFGKYDLPAEDLRNIPMQEIFGFGKQGKKVGHIHGLCKTDDFIVLSFTFKNEVQYCFHSLKNKKTYYLNDSFESNTIPELKIYGVKTDGTFYGLIEPENLIKFQKGREMINGHKINENDNPYLILFTVRKS